MKQFALPKSCLLRKSGEYSAAYRQGRRLHGSGFSLICLAADQPGSRLGISIRRGTGNAVRRSRIKRLVRETFRLHRELFPPASDIVVAVRPDFAIDSLAVLRAALAGLTKLPLQRDAQA